jgi:hypothetical protein
MTLRAHRARDAAVLPVYMRSGNFVDVAARHAHSVLPLKKSRIRAAFVSCASKTASVRQQRIWVHRRTFPPLLFRRQLEHGKVQVGRIRIRIPRDADIADWVAGLDGGAFLQSVGVAVEMGVIIGVRQQFPDSQAPVGRNRRQAFACKIRQNR